MSNGHTPVKEQGGLPYDFVETPSKYDDLEDIARRANSSAADSNIFNFDNSDDVLPNNPDSDIHNPHNLEVDAFDNPESELSQQYESGLGPNDRQIGSRALNQSPRHPGGRPGNHSGNHSNNRSVSNQFYAPGSGGMPMPVSYDSSIVNLPPPGVLPDASEVAPPPGMHPENFATDDFTPEGSTNTSDDFAPTPADISDDSNLNSDLFSDSTPENNPSNGLEANNTANNTPEGFDKPLTVTLDRPLEASGRNRGRRNRGSNRGRGSKFVSTISPLAPSKDDETKFQAEKGRLGGAAKKELAEGERAVDRGDLESALRHIRNAMAGYTGEYADRDQSDFRNRMWKDAPETTKEGK